MPSLETAYAAGIAVESLSMLVYERTQQAQVGARNDIGLNTAGRRCVASVDLSGVVNGQLGFQQTVEAQQRWMRPQRLARKRPCGFMPLLSPQLAKHNIEGIQRRKAHIVRLQYLQAFLLPTHKSIALTQISRHEPGVFRSSRQDRLEKARTDKHKSDIQSQ